MPKTSFSILYDLDKQIRPQAEWQRWLNLLLDEYSNQLQIHLAPCNAFIQKQNEQKESYGCHLDFRGMISEPLSLEICGILSFTANWNETVSIGAYHLLFDDGCRLGPADSVWYSARDESGWMEPVLEEGHFGEWSQYDTTLRWDVLKG